MSEERRKRQRERDGASAGGKKNNILIYGGIVVLLAAAYYAGWRHKNHKYDAFAQCLATKQVKMYGLYWCPHCLEQKAMFGQSFHYVRYVECAIKGSSELAPECKVAGAKLFPSWQFGVDPPKEGILSMEALSDRTGCSLP
jgi:LPXTG-motif cell wall-anchored protein